MTYISTINIEQQARQLRSEELAHLMRTTAARLRDFRPLNGARRLAMPAALGARLQALHGAGLSRQGRVEGA